MISNKIGIIGGNGWLGSAIARSIVTTGLIQPANLMISSRKGEGGAAQSLGVPVTADAAHLVEWADVVMLSIPPNQFKTLKLDLSSRLVISVMAGVSSADIAARTGATRIVRTMPNAAAQIGHSFTPWFASADCSAADRALVQALFDGCGTAAQVMRDADIDYCVGLTGAGAAFPALLAEALAKAAIEQGLDATFARRAAQGIVCGASRLFEGPEGNTQAIVQGMIDYNGTTAAALKTILAAGFDQAVAEGLRAALAKSATIAQD